MGIRSGDEFRIIAALSNAGDSTLSLPVDRSSHGGRVRQATRAIPRRSEALVVYPSRTRMHHFHTYSRLLPCYSHCDRSTLTHSTDAALFRAVLTVFAILAGVAWIAPGTGR